MCIKEESRQTRRALFSLLLFESSLFLFLSKSQNSGLKKFGIWFGAKTKEQTMEKLAMHACDDYLFIRKKKICFRRYHYQVRIITIKLH